MNNGGKNGRYQSKNTHELPMDIDNTVGVDCGNWGKAGWRRVRGKEVVATVIE